VIFQQQPLPFPAEGIVLFATTNEPAATSTSSSSGHEGMNGHGNNNGETNAEYDDPNYDPAGSAIGGHGPRGPSLEPTFPNSTLPSGSHGMMMGSGMYGGDDLKRSSGSASSAAASSLASLRPPSVSTAGGGIGGGVGVDLPWPTPPPSPGYSPTSFARHLPADVAIGLRPLPTSSSLTSISTSTSNIPTPTSLPHFMHPTSTSSFPVPAAATRTV
jgi:hypothetical protein